MEKIDIGTEAFLERLLDGGGKANVARGPKYRSRVSEALDAQGRMDKWFIAQMGVSQSLFYAIEAGRRNPTTLYRRLASSILGLPERELFELIERPIAEEPDPEVAQITVR